jgi:hypothetical protein
MSIKIVDNQRETEITADQKDFSFHYVCPNSENDRKREGRSLRIRNNGQRRWFSLGGREINALKKILQEAGELD